MVDFKKMLKESRRKKNMKKKLFTDVFSPQKLENFILPERISKQFKDGIGVHSLFYGTQGVGKSALAKILMRDHPHLYINASEEGRIEVLRGEINNFCSEVQLNNTGNKSSIKVVFLDEIDGVSLSFFDALKGFMDQYGENVRFIATSNYINKIPAPIQSRFDCINFNTESSQEEADLKMGYRNRLNGIITKPLKSTIEDVALDFIVDQNFPDFRGALQTLQRLHVSGLNKITLEDVKKRSYEFKTLYDLILDGGKPEDIHTILMGDYATKVIEVLSALDEGFINYIKLNRPNYHFMIPHICIEVAKYQGSLHTVIDLAITMKACVYRLMALAANSKK